MQALGVISVFVWVAVTCIILFSVLKATVGLRVSDKEQLQGLDIGEHGSDAYSGFQIFSNM